MIIVKGRELLIPENERYIGTNYDAGMENRLFRIPRYSQSGTDLSDLTFKINLIFEGDPLDRAEMTKAVDDDYIYLTWIVTEAQVAVTGTVFVCVTGNDTNDTVKWSSFQAPFYTEKSLGDDIDIAYRDLVNKVAKEITDRESAVAAEKSAREAADTTLQQNINAEASARTAGYAALNTRIDNIVAQSGDDITEIVDARTGADNTVHASLKARLDAEHTDLKKAIDATGNWLGYPVNLFNARLFAITNTTNWTIQSATETSFTILHNNTYGTGAPEAPLNLASGEYVLNANFTGSSLKTFALVSNGTFVEAVGNGEEFTVDGTKTNVFLFAPQVQGTFTVTDISVNQKTLTGKIPSLEGATSINATKIADLEEGLNSIATPSIEPMEGTETQARAIEANGEIYTAGSNNYRIAKFAVSPGKVYWITATTNWGNALWCFYDSNNAVVQVGTVSASGSDDTIVRDEEVTAPAGAAYLVIAYNSTVLDGHVKTQTGYTFGGEWHGKKWVCVGDSLTAENIRTTKHYFDYVADVTGITVVNMGYSGSGYARLANENHAFYQRISDCPTDADVVTIFGSFNDLGAGLPLGTVTDTGTDTIAGCINTTITNLQTVIPLVNLGIVAPTPWATAVPATSGEDFNYVEMIKAICAKRSIPYLDLWRESNLRPWDADFRALAYSKDDGNGTHPDENGHKLIAPRFKGFLETLLL